MKVRVVGAAALMALSLLGMLGDAAAGAGPDVRVQPAPSPLVAVLARPYGASLARLDPRTCT